MHDNLHKLSASPNGLYPACDFFSHRKFLRVRAYIFNSNEDHSNSPAVLSSKPLTKIDKFMYLFIEPKFWNKLESLLHSPCTKRRQGTYIEDPNLIGRHADYLLVIACVESGLFSFWTARGTNVKPRVWWRPKLTEEGVESEVLNFETAETRPLIVSSSISMVLEASSLLWTACLRWSFCLRFLDGWPFLKNSKEVGNLCLSTRCCWRLL